MLALAIAIFFGETLLMLLLQRIGPFPPWTEALLDATLLLMISFPALYGLAFRPLTRELAFRERAEQDMRAQHVALQQARDALEASERRYADLFNHSPVGYMVLDHRDEVTKINQTGAQLLGLTPSEACRRQLTSWLSQEDREIWQRCRDALAQPDAAKQTCKMVLQCDDGSAFYALLDCKREEAGPNAVIRITFTDITRENFTVLQLG